MSESYRFKDVTLTGGLTAVQCEPREKTSKPPILFCHGWMSGAWQWKRLQPFMANHGYSSLAVNYRGHCGSAPVKHLPDMKFQDYYNDAKTALESLEDRSIVIGQSTGGLISQKLAEAGLVSAVVLSCSVPPAGIEWKCATTSIADLRRTSESWRYGVMQPDRVDFDDLVYNCMPKDLADEAFTQQVPESGGILAQLFAQEVAVNEKRVTCPVFSVVTGADRLVLPETGLAIAAKYNALSIVRPHAGHYGLIYEPGWEATAKLVVDWLDDLPR